jgi:hypothetical protein
MIETEEGNDDPERVEPWDTCALIVGLAVMIGVWVGIAKLVWWLCHLFGGHCS